MNGVKYHQASQRNQYTKNTNSFPNSKLSYPSYRIQNHLLPSSFFLSLFGNIRKLKMNYFDEVVKK